jgi:hypothetical protein
MTKHDAECHSVVGQAARESEAGRGTGDRLETKMLQAERASEIPRVRDYEAAALVKLAEGHSFLGDCRHCFVELTRPNLIPGLFPRQIDFHAPLGFSSPIRTQADFVLQIRGSKPEISRPPHHV